jgi:hypothetical protein
MSTKERPNAITKPGNVKQRLHYLIDDFEFFKIGKTGQTIPERAEDYPDYDDLLKLGESSVREKVNDAEENFIVWACETFPDKCQNEIDESTGKMYDSGAFKLYLAFKE